MVRELKQFNCHSAVTSAKSLPLFFFFLVPSPKPSPRHRPGGSRSESFILPLVLLFTLFSPTRLRPFSSATPNPSSPVTTRASTTASSPGALQPFVPQGSLCRLPSAARSLAISHRIVPSTPGPCVPPPISFVEPPFHDCIEATLYLPTADCAAHFTASLNSDLAGHLRLNGRLPATPQSQ